MAQMLYLIDGSAEVVLGDPEETLHKVIYERLGRDCDNLLTEVVDEASEPEGDDYEKIADGYLNMLTDTVQELDTVLKLFEDKRLDRVKIRYRLECIMNNLINNL